MVLGQHACKQVDSLCNCKDSSCESAV